MSILRKKKVKEPKLEPVLPSVVPDDAPAPAKLTPPDEPKLELAPQKPVEPPVDPDYLRQYQYKKVSGNPVIGGKFTDPDTGSKASIMKKSLLAQPKTRIFIPRAETEDPKVKLSVTLNGYRLDFPKNVYLEVPQQIAEVIVESLNQQVAALLPFQIGRDKATQDALS